MLHRKCLVLVSYVLCLLVSLVYAEQIYHIEPKQRPAHSRITIITSVFKCDKFIEGFMQDIVQQTIFAECELLMINANSPGNEEAVIMRYMKQYPNITYVKLEKDPGLYGVWNLGIRLARSEYVTNANTDDRLAFNCYALHAQMLDNHPEVDLVYSDFYLTDKANETMKRHTAFKRATFPEFEPGLMHICLPNNHPMWRTSFHEKYRYFDESYFSGGDWEMWCRAVEKGALFKKVLGVLSLCYKNPAGLSTNIANKQLMEIERNKIIELYGYFFYKH